MKRSLLLLAGVSLQGCALMQWAFPPPQPDKAYMDESAAWRNAWVGAPQEALDLQPFFASLPVQARDVDNVQIRTYYSGSTTNNCRGGGIIANQVGSSTYAARMPVRCSSGFEGCVRTFYLKDRKIVRAETSGQCLYSQDVYPRADFTQLADPAK